MYGDAEISEIIIIRCCDVRIAVISPLEEAYQERNSIPNFQRRGGSIQSWGYNTSGRILLLGTWLGVPAVSKRIGVLWPFVRVFSLQRVVRNQFEILNYRSVLPSDCLEKILIFNKYLTLVCSHESAAMMAMARSAQCMHPFCMLLIIWRERTAGQCHFSCACAYRPIGYSWRDLLRQTAVKKNWKSYYRRKMSFL